MNALQSVGAGLSIQNNTNLTGVTMNALQSVGAGAPSGGLNISDNPLLLSVFLPSLALIGSPGGANDNFVFNGNAIDATVGRLTIELPPLVRLHGTGNIIGNERSSQSDMQAVASKFDNAPFAAFVVVNNVE